MIVFDDAEIRAQLHTDILSAWAATKVYDDTPKVPASAVNLPLAYIQIADFKPVRGGGTASMAEVSIWHEYTLTGQFPWPVSGTIQADKVVNAQALASLLTVSNVYLSKWRRDVKSVTFAEKKTDAEEPYYEVSLGFSVEVRSDP